MIAIFVVAAAVQFIGAYMLISHWFRQDIAKEIEEAALGSASMIQNTASYFIANKDFDALNQRLELAVNSDYVTDAIALDCDGSIYSAGNGAQLDKDPSIVLPGFSLAVYNKILTEDEITVTQLEDGSSVHDSYIPIPCPTPGNANSAPLTGGALIMRCDFSPLIEEKKQLYLRLGALALLLYCFVLVIGTAWLYKYMAGKLNHLAAGMQRFSSKDKDYRYKATGADEIDRIGMAFNSMADVIQRQLLRIQNTNRRLVLTDKVLELNSAGVVILSKDLMILDVNPAFVELNGYDANEVVGKPFDFLVHEISEQDRESMLEEAGDQGTVSREFWSRSAQGKRFRKLIKLSPIHDDDGNITHYFIIENNVTDEYVQNLQLKALAVTDSLTGLGNRRQFEIDCTAQKLDRAGCCALALIGLDGIKEINNKYDHMAGDQLIEAVGRRLAEQAEGLAKGVYRHGGDEFCVLIDQPQTIEELTRICRSIKAGVEGPVGIDLITVDLTIGLGASYYDPSRHTSIQDLITESDIALKEAKRTGRSSFLIATEDSLSEQERRTNLSLALKSPKLENQIEVSYLPKVDIQNNILAGAEALIRWNSPELGFVRNEEFVPIAEETGDILRIDEWVMRRAITDAATFGKLIDGFQTTINLSPRQLFRSEFAEALLQKLETNGVDTENFSVEITEWTAILNYEQFIPALNHLRSAGVSIELDDFGTGHSSLVNLHKFPADALKIDREFVKSMPENPVSLEIVRSIILLARSLHMTVVAEGVENLDQLELLRELGCDYCQGYLYSEPVVIRGEKEIKNAINSWQEAVESLR